MVEEEQSGELHAQGARSLGKPAASDIDPGGAQNPDGVDTGVAAKARVLGRDQRLGECRGDIVALDEDSALLCEGGKFAAVRGQDSRHHRRGVFLQGSNIGDVPAEEMAQAGAGKGGEAQHRSEKGQRPHDGRERG